MLPAVLTMSLQAPDLGEPSSTDDAKVIFDSLQEYLQSDQSNAEPTAVKITAPINSPSEAEASQALEGSFGLLWTTFLHVVKQVPHEHPWQGRLVDLLATIKRLPPPTHVDSVTADFERVWRSRDWVRLPLFGVEMRESWNKGPLTKWPEDLPPPLPEWAEYTAKEWANWNAFAARLTVAMVSNFDTYATSILRHTLEEERLQEEINDNLPATALWIIYAGTMLYHNAAREDTAPPPVYQSQGIVYLRKFPKRFSKERWGYWKERFTVMYENQSLSQDARNSAGDALDQMRDIESRWPEPSVDAAGPAQPHSGLMLGAAFTAAGS